jgi:RNA polymerase sigma-70 factor (ECF subfamily)
VLEPVWLEPLGEQHLAQAIDEDAPDVRYEQRETLELAFLAALQHLPGNQRAALLLCEVLGFTASEAARMLDTTPATISSALQRARATLDRRRPQLSQRELLDELGDEAAARLVGAYVDALQHGDVERLAGLLAEDVTFSMPPFAAWWRGRPTVLAFIVAAAGGATRHFVPLRVNGQLAFAGYRLDAAVARFVPEVLEVLALDERRQVSTITAFVDPAGPCEADLTEPTSTLAMLFPRLGLPPTVDHGA